MLRRSAGPVQWALAIFLSVVLWVISIEGKSFEVTMKLPVPQPALSPDFIVLEGLEGDSVTVVFQGSGIEVLLDQLTSRPEAVRLNMTVEDQTADFPVRVSRELTEGDLIFRDSPYSRLSASTFIPGSVSLTIDRTVTRDLPIAIRTVSDLPDRYYWRSTSVETVEIKGAESVVSMLDSLYTCPVTPDSVTVNTSIVKPDGVVYISPSSITVELVPPVRVISQLQ
ncbi:MAG: YbbR-like domain-containing protein [Candidatus Fermentibacteraceae bacterium]|nr:YbbR-like domain-containing protein [Candidatus Fermentibacteraceae bacterium]MBN2608277.1 YbbR-like domain-containing protein [Candidatus Fermentibacteraceae bacterium]